MILTNKFQYPNAVAKAAEDGLYLPSKDILRVTELVDSPLIKRLTIEYWDKITIDVDEIVYASLFGTAWHKFLSGFEVDALIEKRWNIKWGSILLTGQTDIYKPDKGIIEDNKTQSAWAFVFGNPSWEAQLNCYAYLIEESGYSVNELWINSFLRDWSKFEAMKGRNRDYPKHKFHKVRVPLWGKDKRKLYIKRRLNLHLNNEDYVCTPEERWQRKTTYAVMKRGVKTAKRVLDTKEKAQEHIVAKNLTNQQSSGTIYIEERKGGCTKCNDYCICRNVCKYREE